MLGNGHDVSVETTKLYHERKEFLGSSRLLVMGQLWQRVTLGKACLFLLPSENYWLVSRGPGDRAGLSMPGMQSSQSSQCSLISMCLGYSIL